MTKYVYNTTDIYTLLFKSGTIEIPRGKYIPVEDNELGEDSPYKKAELKGQVKIFDREEDVPVLGKTVEVKAEVPEPSKGLTEAELKAFLAAKSTEYKPPGIVTELGKGEPPKSIGATTSIGKADPAPETAPETEPTPEQAVVSEPEQVEAPKTRGRKPSTPK